MTLVVALTLASHTPYIDSSIRPLSNLLPLLSSQLPNLSIPDRSSELQINIPTRYFSEDSPTGNSNLL